MEWALRLGFSGFYSSTYYDSKILKHPWGIARFTDSTDYIVAYSLVLSTGVERGIYAVESRRSTFYGSICSKKNKSIFDDDSNRTTCRSGSL